MIISIFITMCDDGVSSEKKPINNVITTVGLWLDTFPQMQPFLTSDLQIKFNIKTNPDSTYDIEMKETDTQKHLFIHRGTWTEDQDNIYIKGDTCLVLEKEGDTLSNNEDLIDTTIAIRKDELDTTSSPDVWNLRANDMAFLIESMNLGVGMSILGNIPIELERED